MIYTIIMATGLQKEKKISDAIDYVLKVREEQNVEYFYQIFIDTINPPLSKEGRKRYWDTIDSYRLEYSGDVVDVMIVLGLSKISTKPDCVPHDDILSWIMARAIVEMMGYPEGNEEKKNTKKPRIYLLKNNKELIEFLNKHKGFRSKSECIHRGIEMGLFNTTWFTKNENERCILIKGINKTEETEGLTR